MENLCPGLRIRDSRSGSPDAVILGNSSNLQVQVFNLYSDRDGLDLQDPLQV